ncbi:hypothetical protein MKW94_003898, partial [Papaver nudicaule]|nr:hypothetical protein [Papaver nudicaule]
FASGALGKLELPQFCNLKCLKLRTSLSRDSLNTIIYMLKITPYVETIHLEITQRCTYGSGKPIPEHPMYPYIDE